MSAMPEEFFDPSVFAEAEPFLIGFLIFFLVFYLIIMIFGLVSYILSSVGMYTIAKRRGIHNPWLAWIPVANSWILGSISDQFQYVTKGKIRNRRKWLLGLNIASAISPVVMMIVEVTAMLVGFGSGMEHLASSFGLFIIIWLIMVAFMIVLSVFTYMALYDLYHSCNPYNAVTFLLLSIFVSVTQPFFVFACRKKDEGMPPRKQPEEPVQQIPQQIPQPTEPAVEPEVTEAPEVTVEPTVETVEPCVADETDFVEVPPENE